MEESRWTDERHQERSRATKKRKAGSRRGEEGGENVFENIEQRVLVNTHKAACAIYTHKWTRSSRHGARRIQGRQRVR